MKRRHVLAVLGLSFITLGIYVIYWLYKTRKELLAYLPDKNAIPRVIILFTPVLGIVGLIIFSAIVGAAVPYESTASTVFNVLLGILAVVVVLGAFVVSFWWFYHYFKGVEAVVQGNDAMLYYTLWIILTMIGFGPIWVLIVQSDLNKFIDNGNRPLKVPAPAAGPQQQQQQQWQQPPMPPQPYGQPYPQQPYYPPNPYQQPPQQQYGAPQPTYQQPYPQYPQQPAPQQYEQPHYGEHGQHHPHHEQHHAHHEHGHHDEHHNGQNQHHQPPQNQA